MDVFDHPLKPQLSIKNVYSEENDASFLEKGTQKLPKKAKRISTCNNFLISRICGKCEDHLLPLGCLDDQNDEKRISLWGRDRLRNDPPWFPGFLSWCSWMFPEQLRNKSELVGSEDTRQVLTRHPRYETLSYRTFLRVF